MALETNTGGDTEAAHMVAEAKLLAHYVAAALQAGFSAEQINSSLRNITDTTVITEIYVTDGDGNIEYTSHPEIEFTFPADPNSGTQAAAFAQLLDGSADVVVQDFQPRELDGAPYRYVAVTGVVRNRIVQVGIAGSE